MQPINEPTKEPKNELTDSDELEVAVPLREQISKKLYDHLKKEKVGIQVSDIWTRGNSDRAEYLQRQEEYLQTIEEFIDPLYIPSTDWGSAIHLPTVLTVCKTFHARFNAALMGQRPPFQVQSRTAANVERAKPIEQLMEYTLFDWANNYAGIEEEVDRWVWDWCTRGKGILKQRWDRQFTRFEDVIEEPVQTTELVVIDEETGETELVPSTKFVEKAVIKEIEKFNGPCIERKHIEDVLIVGGDGCPQKADYVIESLMLTASDMRILAARKVFNKKAVEKAIKHGRTYQETGLEGNIKQRRSEMAGDSQLTKDYEIPRFQVLESYLRVDVDGSGIDSDIVVWVHKESGEILRASYLFRLNSTGMRPYGVSYFHKRDDSSNPIGLVEILYNLGKEIDTMHNLNIDIGILTSMPFGFYQPTAGNREEKLELEPGSLIPVDNPKENVVFPNLGTRTAFGMQEEAALFNHIQRVTGVNDLNFAAVTGTQGPTRTAAGVRSIMGESNANLDIYLRRLNRGWKQVLKNTFVLLQDNLPPGFQFRITGDDGNRYWSQVESREELAGLYDFEIDANSSNSNPQVQQALAQQIYQMTANPIDIQLGLITPQGRYEALKNLLTVNRVRDYHKYIRLPDNTEIKMTPVEILNRIISGYDVIMSPTQDWKGFIELASMFMQEEELNGQFSTDEMMAIQAKMQEAQQFLQAMEQAQAQQANMQQQVTNQASGEVPGNVNINVLSQQPGLGAQ